MERPLPVPVFCDLGLVRLVVRSGSPNRDGKSTPSGRASAFIWMRRGSVRRVGMFRSGQSFEGIGDRHPGKGLSQMMLLADVYNIRPA